jgi:hypothetical protein
MTGVPRNLDGVEAMLPAAADAARNGKPRAEVDIDCHWALDSMARGHRRQYPAQLITASIVQSLLSANDIN